MYKDKRFITKNLFMILTSFMFLLSCKPSEDGKLNNLVGGGGGANSTNSLEITARLPDAGEVRVEIGQSQNFFITGTARFPRTVSYSWTLNGNTVVAVNEFTFTGTSELVGNHELKVRLSDGRSNIENTWLITVNGPPSVEAVTQGIPKVSVGSEILLQASATDPNNDSLSYEWLLNGAESPYLVGSGTSATLTGHESNVGERLVTLRVSDGGQSASVSWSVEVNWFPNECNELEVGEICTFAGTANKGSGTIPGSSDIALRIRPIGFAQDSLGNLFLSDLDNHVVWYWNQTSSSVQRLGQTIPAGVIQVIAGTGEALSGSAGMPALQSALNSPRGLWYDDVNDRLFISEWGGNTVKFVNTSGTVFVGMGGGASNVDGQPAFTHICRQPADMHFYEGDLYVACYTEARVKRWNLATDQAYLFAGTGGDNVSGNHVAPTSGGVGRPYGIYIDETGGYITAYTRHAVRYVNTTGAPVNFWSGTASNMTVSAGQMATIIGTGSANNTTAIPTPPLNVHVREPVDVFVRNQNEIFVVSRHQAHLAVANNSGSSVSIQDLVVPHGHMARFNHGSPGFNGSTVGINNIRMNSPYAMALDNQDNNRLLVADYSNFRMRDIRLPTGAVSDFLGSGIGRNGTMGDFELPTPQHLFNFPTGLVFDNQNRILFFADQNNHRIRQVNRFGLTRTVVGSGTSGVPAEDDQFPVASLIQSSYNTTNSMTNSVDLFPDGSLIQVNSYGHNVRIWNRGGAGGNYLGQYISSNRISTVAGNWPSGPGDGPEGPALGAQLRHPNGARYYNNNGQGEVFIIDTMNHCIRRVDESGSLTTALGNCGNEGNPGFNIHESLAQFNRPRDITFDSHGNMFIADQNNHHIWYWNRGDTTMSVGSVTIAPQHVAKVGCMAGTGGSSAENILVVSARCNHPTALAISNNQLCYAQYGRHNVRCFDVSTGIVRTVAGALEATPSAGSPFDFSQEGVPATDARFLHPSGLTFDDEGNLYISDTHNHIIRKLRLFSND
jgi:hypothetical protein